MAAKLQFYAVLFIVAAASSFTLLHAEETTKSEEPTIKENAELQDTSNQEESKEKRSQEEIMFGNQQNKPNGLVDDLMALAENLEDDENNSLSTLDDSQKGDDKALEEMMTPSDDKQSPLMQDMSQSDVMAAGDDSWYKSIPVSKTAMQYLANSQAFKNLPPDAYSNRLYDQEDLYRRKRAAHPLQKRSLRTSLGQMIQKRGIRMPRRSMRLKRQAVDMEDLWNLFGNERYYNDEEQVPGRFSGYPESSATEYRYPYVFQHRDDGILSSANDIEENSDALDVDNLDDIDNLMMLPPNTERYSDMGLGNYGSQNEEKEAFQKWLSRNTIPATGYRIQRRSAPLFYPIDYRYIPAYKKRSSFRNVNRANNRFSGQEESDSDFGKWGHVVQVPEAYASPEDIARLYGLASLMAEGEESNEAKMRRTA